MTDIVFRGPAFSTRFSRRLVLVNAGLALFVLLLFSAGLFGGTYPINFANVLASLGGTADPVTEMVVLGNRLPRLLTAVGVGIAFGLAGEMTQTLLRNPLASPDVIGFTSGAGLGAVFSVAITGATAWVLPGAILGGALTAVLLILLTLRSALSPGAIVLMGVGLTVTLGVVTDLLMTRLDASNVAELVKWIIGSVSARSWADVQLIWLGLAVLVPLSLWHQFTLARLNFSDNVSQSLGVSVPSGRLITIVLAVILVGLAVAAAGPLPFVAFVAGPIAHGLSGAARPTLIAAALVGAIVTLLADMAVQALPGIFALPTGIFTALIGAPVLIWILIFQARKRPL